MESEIKIGDILVRTSERAIVQIIKIGAKALQVKVLKSENPRYTKGKLQFISKNFTHSKFREITPEEKLELL